MLWGFKKFCPCWSLRPLPVTFNVHQLLPSSLVCLCCALASQWQGHRAENWKPLKQLCLLKESLCRAFSLLWNWGKKTKCSSSWERPHRILIFFKFYINYVVPFESSLIQTHKCSQSRTWMFFPAVSDLPPSVLLLRHCGTWHPFHVKQLKGDT